MPEMVSCILPAHVSSPSPFFEATPSLLMGELADSVANRALRYISWERRVELHAANWLEFLAWEEEVVESYRKAMES